MNNYDDMIIELNYNNGEDIASYLSDIGLRCVCKNTIVSPNTIIHEFNLRNGLDVQKVSRYAKVLQSVAMTPVRVVETFNAHFAYEITRDDRQMVKLVDHLKDVKKGELVFGIDNLNNLVRAKIDEMPHLLIGGETGAGKSVMLNSLIVQLITHNTPAEVGLVMIDKKRVELSAYESVPHLMRPLATTDTDAGKILWALNNLMDERYKDMAKNGDKQYRGKKVVVIIDELADLVGSGYLDRDYEITRLARMGRASGIHLILATQRPTVKVCSGAIKANIPTRIALQTVSVRDSMNILDKKGAEGLLGKGDCLIKLSNVPNFTRVQGFYISDEEIAQAVKSTAKPKVQKIL
jgi:S-DNA-T family DNA segregation ATPase FtsK/SpoIIIE